MYEPLLSEVGPTNEYVFFKETCHVLAGNVLKKLSKNV